MGQSYSVNIDVETRSFASVVASNDSTRPAEVPSDFAPVPEEVPEPAEPSAARSESPDAASTTPPNAAEEQLVTMSLYSLTIYHLDQITYCKTESSYQLSLHH